MTHFFITGTDTDVGKTIVTGALLRSLLDAGHNAAAVKPIQTGCTETANGLQADDVTIYGRLAAPHFPEGYPDLCCRKFIPACSPHLAARMAGEELNLDELLHDISDIGKDYDPILVEGAGGVHVPLGNGHSILDLMKRLAFPVIIVADNKLGMVNHTLLTIEAVRNQGLEIAGLIINNTTPASKADAFIRKDNIDTVTKYGDVSVLCEIPNLDDDLDDERLIQSTNRAIANLPSPSQMPDDQEFDRNHIWHPYTSSTNPLPTVKVKSTQGSRITLDDGKELIDGMASWWCAIHGYGHPALDSAMKEQIGRMSHVMFGGITHSPAIKVSKMLLDMAPAAMEHVFLADSGSVSVEVALKMAMQYMQSSGQPQRTKLFTIRGGYHGDTCGAMSVCDPDNGMHHLFSGLLPQQIFAPRPKCRFHEDYDPSSFTETRALMEAHAHEVAAIIVEPIVQGAGGMWFYHPEYLREFRKLADEFDTLLIFDEIATGFGRTGKLFACEWSDVVPDIMCVGKALSGGAMSLAATLATGDVAQTISANGDVLMHGPTFMGNPLACAAATASLDLLKQSKWQQQVANIKIWLRESLEPCQHLENVADVRVLGAIGVVEMTESVNVQRLQEFIIDQGVWIRPFGKLLYVMPPYIISQEEIGCIGLALQAAISHKKYQ